MNVSEVRVALLAALPFSCFSFSFLFIGVGRFRILGGGGGGQGLEYWGAKGGGGQIPCRHMTSK